MLDRFRRAVHPLILKMMPGRRNFEIEVLTPQPYVQENKIFVMNHSTTHDTPIACEVIKEHFYVLVGKQPLEILDRLFFWLNGVIYIDRKNKKSKKRGFDKMLKILNGLCEEIPGAV